MKTKEQNINQWDFRDIFMSIFCISAIMALYLGIAQFFSFDRNEFFYLIISQIIFYIVVAGAVFYFAVFSKSNTLKGFLGIENPKRTIFEGVLIFILIILATTIIDIFFEKFAHVKLSDVYKNIDKHLIWIISFVGVFFAPFAEEIFFRGFLQPVFVKKLGVNLGIILVALIFSLLHLLYINNISALFSIICVGLILSFAKEKTGSVMPCIIAHFLNNLTAAIYMNLP